MEKKDKLYEGKAKVLYATEDPDAVVQSFKDDATAQDGKKKGVISEKGRVNNQVSATLFQYLETKSIRTHYLKTLSENEMLVKKLEMIPVEVVVRNIATGSISRRLGIQEGITFEEPVVEFYYKNDPLGDPLINRSHIRVLGLSSDADIDKMVVIALEVNQHLLPFFLERKVRLVDFKLEFGLVDDKIILGDEISPDTCRFWDASSESIERMDKDRFRKDLGGEREAYLEVLERISK
jgi:phosphoribosylaminoimidazole-succinocarboxamide synthase